MKLPHALQITALFAALTSTALANAAPEAEHSASQPDAAQPVAGDERTALPSLPLFKLPARASDNARLHVGLAHARRDSRRAEHTRNAAAGARQKTAQRHLAAARARRAAQPAPGDTAQRRNADVQQRRDAAAERRAEAQERRASAARHREAAAEHSDAVRAAAQERASAAGK